MYMTLTFDSKVILNIRNHYHTFLKVINHCTYLKEEHFQIKKKKKIGASVMINAV